MDDNGPPNPELPGLIRRWNEGGRTPFLRLVIPEELFEKVHALPESKVPLHHGDWTDYWNSGCGSLALETQMMRHGTSTWRAARALAAKSGVSLDPRIEKAALQHLLLAHEHTVTVFCSTAAFGPSRQMEPLPIAQQWHHKAACCASALSFAQMLRRDALDAAADNPVQARDCKGLLVFNPSDLPRRVCLRVPSEILAGQYPLLGGTKHRLDVVEDLIRAGGSEWIGPIDLSPKAVICRSLGEFLCATVSDGVSADKFGLRSPHFAMAFEPATGQILSLRHLATGYECVDVASSWDFFGPVRETVALHSDKSQAAGDPRYDLFQVTEQEFQKVHADEDCWNHAWPASRERPESVVRVETRVDAEGAHFMRAFRMMGINGELLQTITLLAHEPRVRCEAYFNKADVTDPESLYFTFPLHMPQAQTHFDSSGLAVAFDRDQLPGACRDWVAVGDWLAVSNQQGCLMLACPDAPMFQIGGFNYGRGLKSASGLNQALLLAWPMNNYWNTNFRASQPGLIRLRYEMAFREQYDPDACARFGSSCSTPVIFHPIAGSVSQPGALSGNAGEA